MKKSTKPKRRTDPKRTKKQKQLAAQRRWKEARLLTDYFGASNGRYG